MPTYRMPVKLSFRIGSLTGMNTWHIRSAAVSVPPAPTITNVVKNFYDACKSLWGTDFTATWDGTLHDVTSDLPEAAPQFTPWTITGTVTPPNYLPAGTGICVTWRSSLATRSGRGRTFLVPIAGVHGDGDGTPFATPMSTVRTAAAALVSSSVADGNGAVVVFSKGTPTHPGKVSRDVVGATVNDKFAFLTSRRS